MSRASKQCFKFSSICRINHLIIIVGPNVSSNMLPFLIVTLLILAAAVPGESFLSQFNANLHLSSARYVASRDLEDSADAAEFLDLSTSDLARIQTARSSRTVMPLIILAEPILPGQSIEFGSNDKRFHALIAHALQNEPNEVGVLGTNPYTGRPLNIGVTAKVSASSIRRDDSDKAMVVLDVVGERRFECAGEPWMDDTSSFYLADIDYSNGRGDSHESYSANDDAGEEESIADSARACALSDSVPDLVETWTYWMAQTGICSRTSMKQIMEVSSSIHACVQLNSTLFTRNQSIALPDLSPTPYQSETKHYQRSLVQCRITLVSAPFGSVSC